MVFIADVSSIRDAPFDILMVCVCVCVCGGGVGTNMEKNIEQDDLA